MGLWPESCPVVAEYKEIKKMTATVNATIPHAKKTTLKNLTDIVKEEAAKLSKDALASVDPDMFREGIAKLLTSSAGSESNDQPKPIQGTIAILAPLDLGETVIGETDGTATIAQAADVFTGYLDSDFKNWKTDKPSSPTAAQALSVYEMRKDATFKQMYDSLGADRDALCLTQAQIIEFCKKHRDKLRQDGYATFFLFKIDRPEGKGPEYFVACVDVDERGLGAVVYRFDGPGVWGAGGRRRVVLPQLQGA